MTFAILRSALAQDDGISGPVALDALLAGGEWKIYSQIVSARDIRAIWSSRLDVMVELRTQQARATLPRRMTLESLAQAVDRLDDAGDVRVYTAQIVDPPRRFHIYLSEDLTTCVGVWQGSARIPQHASSDPETVGIVSCNQHHGTPQEADCTCPGQHTCACSWPSENGTCRIAHAAAAWPATVRSLPVGSSITGRVICRRPYGALIAIDGHPDAVGLARAGRMPRCMELPTIGQSINGMVFAHVEHVQEVGVSLHEWTQHEDPLPRFTERVGHIVIGRVTKVGPLGFFVRVADCLEGLVPLTEPITDPAKSAREGQDISVQIVDVDLARARIVLAAEDVA
ncbi:S1 RNA-binding domain-containing protein [Streptomyces sp. NPDC005195]|uniref:S1 RNA-binding domain-containing protein n=1 Tax=Streptomyces sp. NPDC005195 TaxID=3154561 RepID=UPI0033B00D63